MWAIQSSDGFSALPTAAVTSEIHVRKTSSGIGHGVYIMLISLNAHAHARVSNARCQTGLNFGERSKFAVATFLSLAVCPFSTSSQRTEAGSEGISWAFPLVEGGETLPSSCSPLLATFDIATWLEQGQERQGSCHCELLASFPGSPSPRTNYTRVTFDLAERLREILARD